jgi:hypothetical protein
MGDQDSSSGIDWNNALSSVANAAKEVLVAKSNNEGIKLRNTTPYITPEGQVPLNVNGQRVAQSGGNGTLYLVLAAAVVVGLLVMKSK